MVRSAGRHVDRLDVCRYCGTFLKRPCKSELVVPVFRQMYYDNDGERAIHIAAD